MSDRQLFVVHVHDVEGAADLRREHSAEHRGYLSGHDTSVAIILAGPLLDSCDSDAAAVGSAFVLEAGSLDEVVRFHQADPYYRLGVWAPAQISPFRRSF